MAETLLRQRALVGALPSETSCVRAILRAVCATKQILSYSSDKAGQRGLVRTTATQIAGRAGFGDLVLAWCTNFRVYDPCGGTNAPFQVISDAIGPMPKP